MHVDIKKQSMLNLRLYIILGLLTRYTGRIIYEVWLLY